MSNASSRIQKLSPLLINQLAAGEVVTRPASVVKEVLENAIDAGATKIDISITQGGMGVIEISDNGTGIHPDDMQMAVTRHATSKVADVESLHGIDTLGFRGEALASIAAVSRFSLTSSHDESGVGRCLTVAGVIDDDANIVPCVCQQGTTVTVKDLYFNVPARRGNLKNVATEYAHIEAVIRQTALAYADIELTLYHEGKKRLTLSAQIDKSSQAQLNRLQQALSVTLPKQAYPLAVNLGGLMGQMYNQDASNNTQNDITNAKIDGWIWVDDTLQDNADLPKLIYINGRLVKNIAIAQQVRQAVNSLDISFNSVGYALFFTLPHDWCNLNVHPSKQRINIHALTNINAHLYQAIRDLLQLHVADIHANALNTNIHDGNADILSSEVLQASKGNETASNSLGVNYVDKSVNSGLTKPIHAVHSPSAIYQVSSDDASSLEQTEIEDVQQCIQMLQSSQYANLLTELLQQSSHTWLSLKDIVLQAKKININVDVSDCIKVMWLKLPLKDGQNVVTVLILHKETLAMVSKHFEID